MIPLSVLLKHRLWEIMTVVIPGGSSRLLRAFGQDHFRPEFVSVEAISAIPPVHLDLSPGSPLVFGLSLIFHLWQVKNFYVRVDFGVEQGSGAWENRFQVGYRDLLHELR